MKGGQGAVDADVRSAVYNTAAGSSRSAWEMLRNMYTAVRKPHQPRRGWAVLLHCMLEQQVQDLPHKLHLVACSRAGLGLLLRDSSRHMHLLAPPHTSSEPQSRGPSISVSMTAAWRLQAGDALEKERLLTALSHASTPETITAALDFALSPAVRSQDLNIISAVAARGGQSLQLAWGFLTRCALPGLVRILSTAGGCE